MKTCKDCKFYTASASHEGGAPAGWAAASREPDGNAVIEDRTDELVQKMHRFDSVCPTCKKSLQVGSRQNAEWAPATKVSDLTRPRSSGRPINTHVVQSRVSPGPDFERMKKLVHENM